MLKKISLILLVFVAFSILIPISAQAANITITINGQNVVFEQKPVIKNDTTLVPMRAFFEALGAKVNWEEKTKTVTAFRGETTVQLIIGHKIAKVNGKSYELIVAPQIINGYTYVPLRFVGETLGDEVIYDNGHIIINSSNQRTRVSSITAPKNTVSETNTFSSSNITSEKDLYLLIKNALENNEDEITFTLSNSFYNSVRSSGTVNDILNSISDIVDLVLAHHPEIGYANKWTISANSFNNVISKVSIKFEYIYPKDKLEKMKDEVYIKAKEIISQIIKPDMSDIDKVKAIHDYIVKNTKYDYENLINNTIPPESYTAYGVFIKGVGVCQGYAAAFNLLAQLAGIDSLGVAGTGFNYSGSMPHAWNMIRIDGKISYVDVTWDDPVPDQGDNVRYDYFNVTEEQLAKDHSWDKEKFLEKYFDYK
ncbi:stalk domain-containing protein [Thermoanaerobacter siderophilus]|uniref:Copper amine oxidase family protein,Transglutaminase-like superfamily protein n=1 Tax=Thermoanaerobacter siderophilus SR4 TaxID=880478 RepID=I8R0M5_9THEO|nr:stalk domain-containing protein [Thermoanaerobacter siderophilus]EIW00983.1 copper amine oxidase family protein,Transglutaminase-like superfamily protein [Thermoanaerobacter siderophilus SR4]